MEGLFIREATVADAHDIAVAHVRSWQQAYRGLVPQHVLDDLDIAAREAQWQKMITDQHRERTLVAEVDRRVLAWCTFGPARDNNPVASGEVWGLYAHPDAWSHGLGHALLAEAEASLRMGGHRRAYLWMLDGNSRGIDFYERHGWLADGGTKVDERPRFTLHEHRRVKSLVTEKV
ncbi:N-acetyltransferase family protein [Microbacterium sp. YY-01]|uniref:GNAT family N-acetyltransferase n=1 Tax=Microbacterium sp. YY-01 TaxID=3421634 RepID=UPI003D16E52D